MNTVHTIEASSPEPSHSRTRKPRLRKEEDEWGTTAEAILKRLGTAKDAPALTRERLRLMADKKMKQKILAHFRGSDGNLVCFATALAAAIYFCSKQQKVEDPIVIRIIAEVLESRTPSVPTKTLAWKEAEIIDFEANIRAFLIEYHTHT